jgi:hypothetical protein
MYDTSDLEGSYPSWFGWNAEEGFAWHQSLDEAGERIRKPIECGSDEARLAMDLSTRERGWGLVRKSVFEMVTAPVHSTPAPIRPSPEHKQAVACWLFNPHLGEMRLATTQTTLRDAIVGLWTRCRAYQEMFDGQVVVFDIADRRERDYGDLGVFWAPVLVIRGWMLRDQIPCFAAREPTVQPSPALSFQIKRALPIVTGKAKEGATEAAEAHSPSSQPELARPAPRAPEAPEEAPAASGRKRAKELGQQLGVPARPIVRPGSGSAPPHDEGDTVPWE